MFWSHVILVLPNVTMKLSNTKKKKSLNVIKVWSHVLLVLFNVTMELPNMRKK